MSAYLPLAALLLTRTTDLGAKPLLAVVHLSGPRRGGLDRLADNILRIGTGRDAEIRLDRDVHAGVAEVHAILHRAGDSYELEALAGKPIRINGERVVDHRLLVSGDVLEIGPGGPVMRFRIYSAGSPADRSMREAFADCADCAASHGPGWSVRGFWFIAYVLCELSTRLHALRRIRPLWLGLGLLALGMLELGYQSSQLENRLIEETGRVSDVAGRLDQLSVSTPSVEELARLQSELSDARLRLIDLENRSLASRRVIATAAGSIAFLQGSYVLREADGQRALRHILGPSGQPVRLPGGRTAMSLGGDGPEVHFNFTGTGFVVGDRLLLTNRHVVYPWKTDRNIGALMERHRLEPRIQRFMAYLPGRTEPFPVILARASGTEDLAVLQSCVALDAAAPLRLSSTAPRPGDTVIVLGYPTGLVALLARTDETRLERLRQPSDEDVWTLAEELAREGQIKPLANRGVVGQISPNRVVYDAATTRGGSGGPVLDLKGGVVAVNASILGAFDGSNMGVPVVYAQQLLNDLRTSESRDDYRQVVSCA